ncbi:MAG: glycosyltransferase family 4 protein [Bacteroidales bacterium]|nr:glycosyltransferase family 4 protein [Bacteroidales bacterium]
MIIGFDAKRAFFNNTGLGNYSRNTLQQLFEHYPQYTYYLYAPSNRIKIKFSYPENVKLITPNSITGKLFKSYWRSFLICSQLIQDKVQIYHGLSNELPFGITETKIKTVVTIHDLIFKRYPQWYKPIDVKIYDRKFKYAAQYANKIIAVSKQTAADIVEFYKVPADKIEVIYQNCNPLFYKLLSDDEINKVKEKFSLPNEYILYVGTIEERKNLHRLVEAIIMAKISVPLIAIGRKTKYFFEKVFPLIQNKEQQFIFIENIDNKLLPAIYQGAKLFVYPSIYEGFGIPILEAQASGVPVITSKGGCFEEVGGVHSIYANPFDSEEIATSILKVLNDKNLRVDMIEKGRLFVKNLVHSNGIEKLVNVYKQINS